MKGKFSMSNWTIFILVSILLLEFHTLVILPASAAASPTVLIKSAHLPPRQAGCVHCKRRWRSTAPMSQNGVLSPLDESSKLYRSPSTATNYSATAATTIFPFKRKRNIYLINSASTFSAPIPAPNVYQVHFMGQHSQIPQIQPIINQRIGQNDPQDVVSHYGTVPQYLIPQSQQNQQQQQQGQGSQLYFTQPQVTAGPVNYGISWIQQPSIPPDNSVSQTYLLMPTPQPTYQVYQINHNDNFNQNSQQQQQQWSRSSNHDDNNNENGHGDSDENGHGNNNFNNYDNSHQQQQEQQQWPSPNNGSENYQNYPHNDGHHDNQNNDDNHYDHNNYPSFGNHDQNNYAPSTNYDQSLSPQQEGWHQNQNGQWSYPQQQQQQQNGPWLQQQWSQQYQQWPQQYQQEQQEQDQFPSPQEENEWLSQQKISSSEEEKDGSAAPYESSEQNDGGHHHHIHSWRWRVPHFSKWGSPATRRVLKPVLTGTLAGLSVYMGYQALQKYNSRQRLHPAIPPAPHPPIPPPPPPPQPQNPAAWIQDFWNVAKVEQSQGSHDDDTLDDDVEVVKDDEETKGYEDKVQKYNEKVFRNTLQFLKAHPDIETYITPSMTELKFPDGLTTTIFERTKAKKSGQKMRVRRHENSYVNLTLLKDKIPTWNKNGKFGSRSSAAGASGRPKAYKILCPENDGKNTMMEDNLFKTITVRSQKSSKFCENALGVGMTKPQIPGIWRTGHGRTIFDLKDGNDTAIGRPGHRNIFLVEKGNKFYKGQERSDTFILVQEGVTGLLDGGAGEENSLILGPSFDRNQVVALDLNEEEGGGGAQIRQSRGAILYTQHTQIIHGRKRAAENITVGGCSDTKFIDGHGGRSQFHSDIIEILKEDPGKMKWKKSNQNRLTNNNNNQPQNRLHLCDNLPYKSLEVKLSRFTKLSNHARAGNFTYIFEPVSAKDFEFQIDGLEIHPYDPRGQHRILFSWTMDRISSMEFDSDASSSSLSAGKKFPRGILTIAAKDFGFSLPSPIVQFNSGVNNYVQQQPTFYTMFGDGVTPEAEIRVNPMGQVNVVHQLDLQLAAYMARHFKNGDPSIYKKYGYSSASNVFNVHGGYWQVKGGTFPDTFVLHDKFTGHLNGGSRHNNSLVLQENYLWNIKVVEMNLPRQFLIYEDPALGPVGRVINIGLENIQRIYGRPNASDLITVDCSTVEVDGRGGHDYIVFGPGGKTQKRKLPDVIKIPPNNEACTYYRTSVVVHPATIVKNLATGGEFSYKILRLGVFNVETNNFPSGTIHNYILPYNFDMVKAAIFDRRSSRISFRYDINNIRSSRRVAKNRMAKAKFGNATTTTDHYHGSHWLKFSKALGAIYHVAPNILTNDGVRFKVNRASGTLMAFAELGQNPEENYRTSTKPFRGMPGIQHTITIHNMAVAGVRGVQFFGADQDDIFILGKSEGGSSSTSGRLGTVGSKMGSIDGLAGQNLLQLSEDFFPGQSLRVDIFRGRIFPEKPDSNFRLKINNFYSIHGRRGENETIVVDCHTKFVSGLGGHDLIIVPPGILSSCQNVSATSTGQSVKMEFIIETFPVTTRVINFAHSGHFIYRIQGVASFDVEKGDSSDHRLGWPSMLPATEHLYQLSFKTSAISKAWFERESHGQAAVKGKIVLKMKKGSQVVKYSVWVPMARGKGDQSGGEFYNTQPKLMTAEGLRISVNIRTGSVAYIKPHAGKVNEN